MKKHVLTLLLVMLAVTGFAQKTGERMYIYRNDGELNSFLRSEIREMSFSRQDTGGDEFEDIVTQVVVTDDSVYHIPLAAIDSISFVTPATVLQPGVTEIAGDLLAYVERSDSLTIYLKNGTPAKLLPKVGDKLVYTAMTDKFPAGFAGKVKRVDDGIIECDAVTLDDVFETYYYVGEATAVAGDQSNARSRSGSESKEVVIKLPTFKNQLGVELEKELKNKPDLVWKVGTKLEFSLTPTLYMKSSLIKSKERGTVFQGYIRGDFEAQEALSFYGGLEKQKEFGIPVLSQPLCPLINVYIKPGVFYKSAVTATIQAGWKQTFGWTFNYDFVEKRTEQPLKTGLKAQKPTNEFEVEGSIDGSISAGVFLEVGVGTAFIDVSHIAVRGEYGVELLGHAVLYNNDIANASLDTKAYEILKNSDLQANLVFETQVEAKLLKGQLNFPIGPAWSYNLAKWDLVPTFSNMEFLRRGTKGLASATMSGNCLMPLKVGFVVTDKDGNKVDSWNANDKYRKGGSQMSTSFDGLKRDEPYKLSPKLVIFDIDMKANPATDLIDDDFPVRIVSFEQTGSHYSKQQGYEYDGKKYFYKFNARTTVELSDEATDVKDWGYVYHDFYGVDKKISCSNLGGRTYADERYAYYYNDPQRTVELSPYVQFAGEADIRLGKQKKVFNVEYTHNVSISCPDENHPHMIDLGLPSGTKWSCCNVGADSPEDNGSHFMWGSTKPLGKEYYYKRTVRDRTREDSYTYKDLGSAGYDSDWHKAYTYSHDWCIEEGWDAPELIEYDSYKPYYDMSLFGSGLTDLGGTKHDAATANWGGSWRMPTLAQWQELVDNCSVEHQLNGGYEEQLNFCLTGPNGKSIIIPTFKFKHEYYDEQDERLGNRRVNENHWYETNLWISDTNKTQAMLFRYIYDWYDPCYVEQDGGVLVHSYPQPQIKETTEMNKYSRNLDSPFVVRPVKNNAK